MTINPPPLITTRELHTYEDLQNVYTGELAIWGVDPGHAVSVDLMNAVIHNGGVLVGAEDGDRLVGFAFAFPARRGAEWRLWSHMAGVLPDYQGLGIGFTLKQHQREWALAHDYAAIAWTFDPMQRGNANFNLHRLGAVADTYHPNHYGIMTDGINAGLPSDRLEAHWLLQDARVCQIAAGEAPPPLVDAYPAEAFLLRQMDDGQLHLNLDAGGPLAAEAWVFVEIPRSLAALKQQDMAAALTWQRAFRKALQTAFSVGYTAIEFVTRKKRCWYVLRRK